MTNLSVPQTKCCKKCGGYFPLTAEYFVVDRRRKFGLGSYCRTCKRHSDEQYRKQCPEKRRRSCCRYYKTHREKIQAYRDANRERRRQYAYAHYWADPKRAATKARRYRKQHQLAERAREQRRRARKKAADGSWTPQDINRLLKLQGGNCWWCGDQLPKNYHIDHRIPLVRGGSNNPSNLVLSCPRCNLSKQDKMPDEFNGRLL